MESMEFEIEDTNDIFTLTPGILIDINSDNQSSEIPRESNNLVRLPLDSRYFIRDTDPLLSSTATDDPYYLGSLSPFLPVMHKTTFESMDYAPTFGNLLDGLDAGTNDESEANIVPGQINPQSNVSPTSIDNIASAIETRNFNLPDNDEQYKRNLARMHDDIDNFLDYFIGPNGGLQNKQAQTHQAKGKVSNKNTNVK